MKRSAQIFEQMFTESGLDIGDGIDGLGQRVGQRRSVAKPAERLGDQLSCRASMSTSTCSGGKK